VFITTHLAQFQNNTQTGIMIIYKQSPSWSAHSSSHQGSRLYRNITSLFSHVQFGFRTFNMEQDSVGCTVTRIRQGTERSWFDSTQTQKRLLYCQQQNRPLRLQSRFSLARLFNPIMLRQIPFKSYVIHVSAVTPSTCTIPQIYWQRSKVKHKTRCIARS